MYKKFCVTRYIKFIEDFHVFDLGFLSYTEYFILFCSRKFSKSLVEQQKLFVSLLEYRTVNKQINIYLMNILQVALVTPGRRQRAFSSDMLLHNVFLVSTARDKG